MTYGFYKVGQGIREQKYAYPACALDLPFLSLLTMRKPSPGGRHSKLIDTLVNSLVKRCGHAYT